MSSLSPKVVIAGGTGFLGLNLAEHLAGEGWQVVLLSRHVPRRSGPWTHEVWDGRELGAWCAQLEGARALVNLAGRTVDCIKSPDHCDEILRSRVDSVRVLGEALKQVRDRPEVWLQMSTAHIYGDPPAVTCDEDSSLGYGLAPTVGRAWEEAYFESVPEGVRQVVLRTSFVIGRADGAFPKLKRLAQWGLGGRVGHGRQGLSWIHEVDMSRLMSHALGEPTMRGMFVASAPEPVSQAQFMRSLRLALRMPIGLPTYEWMIRFGARWVLRTDPELLLYGRYVVSRRLEAVGFDFRYCELQAAVAELCSPGE